MRCSPPSDTLRLVAVADEEQRLDDAGQRVPSRGVARSSIPPRCPRAGSRPAPRRPGTRPCAGRAAAGQRAARERPVQLHRRRRSSGVRARRHAPAQDHRLAEEVADERGGGLLVEARAAAHLLDAAALHDRDAVGEAERLDLVVGDEEDGDAEAALQELQLDAHLLAQLGVEVAERLVEQQQIRLVDERAAEREALLLAAAEQRGRPRSPARPVRPGRARARPSSRMRRAVVAAQLERVGDVLEHGHVRPDRVRLEDHAEVALVGRHERRRRRRGDDAPAQRDLAGVGTLEAGDQAQGRGLAAAARPEQREDLAAPDLERRAVHRRRGPNSLLTPSSARTVSLAARCPHARRPPT